MEICQGYTITQGGVFVENDIYRFHVNGCGFTADILYIIFEGALEFNYFVFFCVKYNLPNYCILQSFLYICTFKIIFFSLILPF